MKSKLRVLFCLGLATLVASCGGSGDHADEVGNVEEALAPAGSNASFVSSTFPAAFFPGERRFVSVTMRNTGTASPANDWTIAGGYKLFTKGGGWGWSSTNVSGTVPVLSNSTFSFIVEAPTTATSFGAQMYAGGLFGGIFTVNPGINNSVVPDWNCTLVGGVPSTLTPNETRTFSVVVRNTGTQTWTPAADFALYSRDNPVAFWGGTTFNYVSAPVAPNATTTFNVSVHAPATAGAYSFMREMKSFNLGPGDFRNSNFCVATTITVGGTSVLDSQVVSSSFPAMMNQGDIATATITFKNTGTETWDGGTNYLLYTQNSPAALWGTTAVAMPTTTAMGQNVTISVPIHATAAPGTYSQAWQLRKVSGTNAGFFGAFATGSTTIGTGTPNYNATVASQTIPNPMTIGKAYQFVITMRNSGTQTWSGTSYRLTSTNSPLTLWGTTFQTLGASESVAQNGTRTFTLNVTPPTTPGTYTSSWQMQGPSGIGNFGAAATTTGIVVTKCGNSVIDSGETCDDNNTVSGDGCSSTCQQEQIVFNLASQTSSRGLLGRGRGFTAGGVTIGDVTGDGHPEVFVAEAQPPLDIGLPTRPNAGAVYGYPNSGLITNSATTNPSGATLKIAGADSGDGLGNASTGNMRVGDVTGDGVGDLVISASGAAGPMNGRAGCGEVWVLAGGASLMSTGFVDLKTSTLPVAHIIGPSSGSAIGVPAVADINGDGRADIIVGSAAAGGGAGALYIISGGSALAGEIDLAAPPGGVTIRTITGAAGDGLGPQIAVGDLNNDGMLDLLAGVSLASPGGRTHAGTAYVRFGPITTNLTFTPGTVGTGSGPSAVFFGQNAFDNFGQSVAIGNVTGTAAGEALVGATNLHRPAGGVQVGGVLIFSNVTSGTTTDLSAGGTATSTIVGQEAGDLCGGALQVGDVNNDGIKDVIYSCAGADGPTNNLSTAGEIDVVFGAASLPATYDTLTTKSQWVMYGGAVNWQLAHYHTALSVGDLDGNGKIDFCAGSTLTGLPSQGRVDCLVSPF